MVLRASEPRRSATSSCAGPKTRRKSLARNLPNLLAAIAVIDFTDGLQESYHSTKNERSKRKPVAPGRIMRGRRVLSAAAQIDRLRFRFVQPGHYIPNARSNKCLPSRTTILRAAGGTITNNDEICSYLFGNARDLLA